MDDNEKLKPEFSYKEIVVFLVRGIALFAGLLIALCVLKKIFVALGFLVSFERVFTSFAQIVAAYAWPVLILTVIYLFKNNLWSVVEAVERWRHGDNNPFSAAPKEVESDEDDVNSSLREEMKSGRDQNGLDFERYVLERLQEEMNVVVLRDVRIYGSGSFDGAFMLRDIVYAVEVKWNPTISALEKTFIRFEQYYRALKDSQRDSFRILLCINDETNISEFVARLRKRFSVPIEYRVYASDFRRTNAITKASANQKGKTE